jgi:hypothetical protein
MSTGNIEQNFKSKSIGTYDAAVLLALSDIYPIGERFGLREATQAVANSMKDDYAKIHVCMKGLCDRGILHLYFNSDHAASRHKKSPAYYQLDPSVTQILCEIERKSAV